MARKNVTPGGCLVLLVAFFLVSAVYENLGLLVGLVVGLPLLIGLAYCLGKFYEEQEYQKIKEKERERLRRGGLRRKARRELLAEEFPESISPPGRRRATIPGHIQEAVYERDGGACVLCGRTEDLEFDHIIPHSKGGADTVANLRLLCMQCNREKGNRFS